MRHYDTSCGPMSCVPTIKDGIPEFVIKPLYSFSNFKKKFYLLVIIKINGSRFCRVYYYSTPGIRG